MNNLSFLQTIRENFLSAWDRFPLAILASLFGYLAITFIPNHNAELIANVTFFSALLFSISLITDLYIESTNKKRFTGRLVAVLLSLIVFLYFRFYPKKYENDIIALTFSLSILFFAVPFIHLKDNEKISYYWQCIIGATIWSGFNFLVFCCGLSLVIVCINVLFEKIIPDKAYQELWQFGFLLLLPVTFLSMLPQKAEIDAVPVCHAPKSLKITITWLFIPLCLMLLTVLYVYFFKNLFLGEFPKSTFVIIVINISIYSIFVYLLSYPLVKEDNIQAGFIQKYIFPLLIIPAIILTWRFYLRIINHGMTEERFYAALIIVWLLINIVCQIIQQRKNNPDLRIPLFTAAALLLVTSLSPFSPARLHFETNQQRSFSEMLIEGTLYAFTNDIEKTSKPTFVKYNLTFKKTNAVSIEGYQYMLDTENGSESILNRFIALAPNLSVRPVDTCSFELFNGGKIEKTITLPCQERVAAFVKDQHLLDDYKSKNSHGDYLFRNFDDPLIVETNDGNVKIKVIFSSLNVQNGLLKPDADITIQNSQARILIAVK